MTTGPALPSGPELGFAIRDQPDQLNADLLEFLENSRSGTRLPETHVLQWMRNLPCDETALRS